MWIELVYLCKQFAFLQALVHLQACLLTVNFGSYTSVIYC